MNYTAIILAGGKSSRMGEDKGLVLLDGKSMAEHLLQLFDYLMINSIIISNNPVYKQFNVPVYEDLIKEKGPLGGIYTGLSVTDTEKNIVVSCDVPCLSPRLIEILLSSSDNELITTLSFKGKSHPLIGIYSKLVKDNLLNEIQDGRLRVRDFVEKNHSKIIELDEMMFVDIERELQNVNTKEELKMIENGK